MAGSVVTSWFEDFITFNHPSTTDTYVTLQELT